MSSHPMKPASCLFSSFHLPILWYFQSVQEGTALFPDDVSIYIEEFMESMQIMKYIHDSTLLPLLPVSFQALLSRQSAKMIKKEKMFCVAYTNRETHCSEIWTIIHSLTLLSSLETKM